MKIEEKIAQGVREAVKALYGADIDIKSAMPGATRKEFEGDYTVVVFPFLRASKQKPEATASAQRALADYIRIIREEAQKRNAQGDPLLAAQEKYKEKKGYGGKQA